MVGSIYLGCVLVLTVLIGLAAQERHEMTQEWDVFRFPRVLINTLRVASFVPALLGVLVYHSFSKPGLLEIAVLAGLFGSWTLIVLAMLVQVSTFSLAVSKSCLKLFQAGRCRTIDFDSVREIVVRWPWRGNGRLDLIGDGGARLCRIDGGVQDFEELVNLVRLYSPDGVTLRQRDTYRRWTVQRARSSVE